MSLQRLFQMSADEIACRSRQEASKWLERVRPLGKSNGHSHAIFHEITPDPALDVINDLLRTGDHAGAGNRLLDRFLEAAPDRFFEGVARQWSPATAAKCPSSFRNQTTEVAEKILRERFDLLGYRDLSFGDPIDWHLDPVAGRRAPFVHWSRLDPRDPAHGGDSKVIWELNRHQWLVRLGQAFWLTADERYAERAIAIIEEWMRANPPGTGINWSSSLEVALRLISWCWTLFLIRKSKAVSADFFLHLLNGIWAHARHVERYLSYYFAPNTHLTGEALGLFYAGVLFPELRSAARWRLLGAQILVEQSSRQVLPDGVYFEQSTCYQRYTIEIYLHFLMLAARNHVTVPSDVMERVQRLLDFLLTIRQGDGSIPQIGDTDGGWLLPLASREQDDCGGLFSSGAAFFGRADYAWAAGALAPETLWLLGAAGVRAVESIRPIPPVAPASRLFPQGGYAVMRSGWDDRAHQLIFDVGPLGGQTCAGHGHADLLSIQCAVFGVPYLVDPGTFCYSADPGWRNHFRGTAAHSTVIVDGAGQAEPSGLFAWKEQPRARLRQWLSTETFDLADAEQDAYLHLPFPVTHRRRVLFIKSWGWVIVDDLAGTAFHHVELRYQFAPLSVMLDPSGWVRAQGTGNHGLLIRAIAAVPLQANLREGELTPRQGWHSPDYGRRQPAPVLSYSVTTSLPFRIVTLLVPTVTPSTAPPAVSSFTTMGPCGQTAVGGLVFGQGQDSVLIREQDILFQQG